MVYRHTPDQVLQINAFETGYEYVSVLHFLKQSAILSMVSYDGKELSECVS